MIEKNGDKNKWVQLEFLRVIGHQNFSKNVIHSSVQSANKPLGAEERIDNVMYQHSK